MELLKQTFNFRGTMSRHSFWMGCLMLLVLTSGIGLVGGYVYVHFFSLFPVYFFSAMVLGLWFLLGFISAGCRRLRDVGFTNTGIVALWILSLLTALTFTSVILLFALLPSNQLMVKSGKRAIVRVK